MARRSHDDALGVAGAETIIGTGVQLTGNLNSESDVTIDGSLTGDIKSRGNVVIGVNATIKANVTGTNVTVAGTLNGNITAEGEASLLGTANVTGDITASGLSIASGAIFIGRSTMTSAAVALDPQSPPNNDATA